MINKIVYVIVVAIFFSSTIKAQKSVSDSIQATIVLIGDAGKLTNGKQLVVQAAQKMVPMNKNTTVIYLGDNLYEKGFPDEVQRNYAESKAILDAQINIAGKAPVNVFFIPGNHDWANGAKDGYSSILRMQQYLDYQPNKYAKQLPRNGCPGPVEHIINDEITLLMIDSQWWLQQYDKPGVESDCDCKTKAELIIQLNEMLANNKSKFVLIAMHHPIRSYGQHGGYFTLKQHIFPLTDYKKNLYIPLPLIGSSYPLTRAVFGTAQDVKHPFYQEMILSLEGIIKNYPNAIFVSGHEHTLQLIKDTNYINIVSGSGSKSTRVSKSRNTVFASPDNGFVTLTVSKNKNVRSTFYTVYGDSIHQAYSENILNFTPALKPVEPGDTARKPEVIFKDSAIISASDKYKKTTPLKNFFSGSNYRKDWNEPVKLKVFNIKKEKGGLKIISLGGGKQTRSLKLVDRKGKEWTLRTIDKDPAKALPPNLRGTIGEAIVSDVISASSPYAPYAVPVLAKAVGVPAANPQFYFVPKDAAFGKYEPLFANTVCMLEERQPTKDSTDTKSTSTIFNKILEQNDHIIDQPAVLNARLLDMYIGDFDRHADQWRWGVEDTGRGKLYYPVPKDRDQAFFNSNGVLLKFLSKSSMPFLQGFKSSIPNIKGLNFVAKDFDRFFMNGLDKTEWQTIAERFIVNMTDDVIKNAASKYPPEIKKYDSAILVQKLIARRKVLLKNALEYYKFLAKRVTISGSNEAERFYLKNIDNKLELSIYGVSKKSDSAYKIYKRMFDENETKEIVIFGLNGNDKFTVDENVQSKIKIRIIGGKGVDTFNLNGRVKKVIYDLSSEKNVLENSSNTKNLFSNDVAVLDYKTTGFQYNTFVFPQLNFGYNAEDKLLLGLGFTIKKYGFRKAPYASMQKVTTLAALSKGAFQAKYEGIFNQVIANNDIVINAEIQSPTLTNFFGYGNSTIYNKNLPKTFYRTRYKYTAANILLRKRFGEIIQLYAGPAYYRYYNEYDNNKNRILGVPSNIGADSASIFNIKEYVGVKLKADVNYLNNDIFPTRGITWFTTLSSMQGINNNSKNLTEIQTDMTIYASLSDLSKVSGIIRAGGGHIFSKNYEFFQAKSLGVNNYLRGFRRNRFSGKSVVYTGGELRVKIFKVNSYILPGDLGLLSYADVGRVWQPGEKSNKWHNSYGGGVYFIPFNLVAITASMGFSNEDQLINFSVGTKFNLNF